MGIDYEVTVTEEDIKRVLNWGLVIFQKAERTVEDTLLLHKLEVLANQLKLDAIEEKTEAETED